MKLLDPLGGLLVTTGSPPMHILYLFTYLVLWLPWIKFSTEEEWLKEYFYWWLLTYFIIGVQFVVMLRYWKGDQTTYM